MANTVLLSLKIIQKFYILNISGAVQLQYVYKLEKKNCGHTRNEVLKGINLAFLLYLQSADSTQTTGRGVPRPRFEPRT